MGRPRTSPCSGRCACNAVAGCRRSSSKTVSRPPTCCPGRHLPSWPSSAPGGCAAGAGGLVGGVCFIVPGLVVILGLSALLLSGHPSKVVWARRPVPERRSRRSPCTPASSLVPASWRRTGADRAGRIRWLAYAIAGAVAAVDHRAVAGPGPAGRRVGGGAVRRLATASQWRIPACSAVPVAGTWFALAWTALKVGALSYGGGFVIIPLMRADAVDRHHWMTGDAVPVRGRVGPDHAGPGGADRGRGRLRRRRAGSVACSRRSSRSRRRLCSCWSVPATSTGCAETAGRRHFWPVPARPRSARSADPRCCWRCHSTTSGKPRAGARGRVAAGAAPRCGVDPSDRGLSRGRRRARRAAGRLAPRTRGTSRRPLSLRQQSSVSPRSHRWPPAWRGRCCG